MRRFYFHIKQGQVTVLDQEGVDLADQQEAAKEAARRGRKIAMASAMKGCPPAALSSWWMINGGRYAGCRSTATPSVRNMTKKWAPVREEGALMFSSDRVWGLRKS
jgi:hypothetical protein